MESEDTPYQSLGDRPEMELDLWQGQFNLSSLQGLEGLTDEEYEEDYSRGSTCWGEDSVVTMGMVHCRLQEEGAHIQEEPSLEERKYNEVKQDNSDLVKKIFILEELLRDSELSHIQTKEEEAARRKELETKLSLERKKNEDFSARIDYLEEENTSLELKSKELDKQLSSFRSENKELSLKISELQLENTDQNQELDHKTYFHSEEKCLDETFPQSPSRLEQSETDSGCHIQDSEELVSDLQSRLAEMESELRVLREGPGCHSGLCEKSLAEEIEDVSGAADEDTDKRPGEKTRDSEILELKARLSSQKDVNRQLQTYIDAVILNIMEKNPELLEVSKQN